MDEDRQTSSDSRFGCGLSSGISLFNQHAYELSVSLKLETLALFYFPLALMTVFV